jgi:hypothetical protein
MRDTDSIFLVNSGGELERVPHQRYQNEDLLQGIVDKTYLLNLIKRLKILYCMDVLGFALHPDK